MQADFEVKYLDVRWYDRDTVLSILESFIPLKTEFDSEMQHFICNTVIYPKIDAIKNGRLAFRYLVRNSVAPYFEAADGIRIPLKLILDKESGKEWWVEANAWNADRKDWSSKTYRTAGKLVVVLKDQICQINIGSSEFTIEQLERYLFDFKSDLWELILDETSYVTGEVKVTQEGGVSEASLHLISNILSHAQQILSNPKSELREIQTLKPRKMVKPVTRTFMELTTKGDSRFLTSRATEPSFNVPENRYVLFALQRIYKILNQLVTISRSKINRFESSLDKLNERYNSFSNEKIIDINLVRKDLERLRKSCDLSELNRNLQLKLSQVPSSGVPIKKTYWKIGKELNAGGQYFVGVKEQIDHEWFERGESKNIVVLSFSDSSLKDLFSTGFEYEVDAEFSLKKQVVSPESTRYNYTIININSIDIVGGSELDNRRNKFITERDKAVALNSSGWIKMLSSRELTEQDKEKLSIKTRQKHIEEQCRNTKLVYDSLEPKLAKFKEVLVRLRALGVKPSSTFPNSMTFVRNPNYQAIHSGYKNLKELTNLSDEDLLLSLERVDEIGLINMPLLYERWCLLQIIKVLIQQYHYHPDASWKRKLLATINIGRRSEPLSFTNHNVKRSIRLMYEPKLDNGRTPDFVMDVDVEQKNGHTHTNRFVMDAKFYSSDLLQGMGGISRVIDHLYNDKDYSENGQNSVFILHPATNTISDRVSPQSWGKDSFLGELVMFDWDQSLRQKHYHQYGAICANPTSRANYLDEFQRLIGMFLQYGVENNTNGIGTDDVMSYNFCLACGSHDLNHIEKHNSNQKSCWYKCNECNHFTTYNHCLECNTRLIKNGDYWSYHSQMPMEPLNIKCPACESLL